MRTIVGVLATAIVFTMPARAQEPQQLTAKQLNGEWTGTLVLDNSSPRLALVFEVKDSTSFTGKVYNDGEVMGDMEGGRITGNKIHFMLGRFDFTGTVTGAKMQVDLIVYNGSTRKVTFTKTPERK